MCLVIGVCLVCRQEESDIVVMEAMEQLDVLCHDTVGLDRRPQLAQQLILVSVALPPPNLLTATTRSATWAAPQQQIAAVSFRRMLQKGAIHGQLIVVLRAASSMSAGIPCMRP